jgi:hypothetical protein
MAAVNGPDRPDCPDRAARILVNRNDFSAEKGIVKNRPFLPKRHRETGALVTSVLDADSLNSGEIWSLGAVQVAAPRGKSVYGHAEISRTTIEEQGLSLERSEPPVRHCHITGWPTTKDEQLNLAQELAAGSQLRLSPQPIAPPPPENS